MAERSQRLRVGVFVAAALAGLSALVILFGGRPNLLSRTIKYAVVFPEAPGVAAGTPVRKSGVRIGQVTGVDLDPDSGRVRVRIELDPRYPPRESEEPVITRGLLSGDTNIDFVPKLGPEGQPVARGSEYTPGTDIPGVNPVTARTLLSQASDVLPTAQESLVRLSGSFERFEKAVPRIERAADEFGSLSRSGRELIPELRQTNAQVQTLLGAADPADPDADTATVRQLLRELNTSVKSLQRAAESVTGTLTPENRQALSATLKNLQLGSDDAVKTIRLAALFLDQIEKTVKLFNDRIAQSERAMENIERATRPFALSSEEMARNLTAASGDLRVTLQSLQGALKGLNQSEGTLGKVLTDPSLYNNLNHSAVELARVLARAEKVARDLEVFADKVARKPELIGIGGAVRPSTGLKESPTAPLPPTSLPPLPPTASVPPGPTGSQEPPLTPIAPVPLP